ncbi:MAG TPA: HD domain-containing phosphohydrolase [Gemmatimonadaceae bacterium]
MTTPSSSRPSVAMRGSVAMQALADVTGEAYVRVASRSFILAFYGTMRNLRLYPFENSVVQQSLQELSFITNEIITREKECEFRVAGEFIFVNGTRLRLDLDNYSSFSALLTQFRQNGIGQLKALRAPAIRDWTVLLGYLQNPQGSDAVDRFEGLVRRLGDTGVTSFELGPLVEGDEDQSGQHLESKEKAKRTYARSVSATKDVINSVRMGQSANIKKIKRVVQGIVDQILSDETSLVGLTTIRDYDDYTFTHSVNVCIFSIALGRRLALTRLQLYDLGMAALFHDIGKARVPAEIINKADVLTDDEWRAIAGHPWLGVLALFSVKDQQEFPYRSMLVAFQHHMKRDLTGYPRSLRTKDMMFYSKIVACADGFDAATSRRSYQTTPMAPSAVLQEMRDNPRRGVDPIIVKAFINLLGIYPVGTFVVLDTFELAIVHGANPDPELLSRPLVRIVSDDLGNVQYPGTVVNLAERTEDGEYRRTIIKTADPDRYGIRVGDYFV